MIDLITCANIDVSEFHDDMSRYLSEREPLIITMNSENKMVLIPYETIKKLIEMAWKYEDLCK